MDSKNKKHKSNISQSSSNINLYAHENTEKYASKIDEMRTAKEKMTFSKSIKYLLSLVILGINWMVYKKIFVVLLTALILVGALVYSPFLGTVLCLFTPVFLGFYGKRYYKEMKKESSNNLGIENERLLIPSSILIMWIMIILVFILLIGALLEKLL